MPISSISQALLRIFALTWFLTGTIRVLSFILSSEVRTYTPDILVPSSVYLISGTVIWIFAPIVSRFITKDNDGKLNLAGITEYQLFSTAFIVVGLYFVLDSFASLFTWLHFFTVYNQNEYGFTQDQQPSYYDLAECALTVAAGAAIIATSKKWAAKLSKTQQN